MGSRKDVLYIFATIILFGVMGLYLAFSKGQTISTVINIPFRNNKPTIQPTINISNEDIGKPTEVIVPSEELKEGKDYFAIFETNLGSFEIDLAESNAPNSVKSFTFLANNKYYDNTTFHRYLPNLLIQGGSRNTTNDNPDDDRFGSPGYVIDDEINWDSLKLSDEKKEQLKVEGYSSKEGLESLTMEKYSIAWASSSPNTNGSQFFIVLGERKNRKIHELEGRHTVFGEISKGEETLDKISKLEVNLDNLEEPKPATEVIIKSIKIEIR